MGSQSHFRFQDKESVGNLVKLIDKTNGYIFAGMEGSALEFSKIAVGSVDWDYYRYPFSLGCSSRSLGCPLALLYCYVQKFLVMFVQLAQCVRSQMMFVPSQRILMIVQRQRFC
ncbi:hypothetical protein RJ640_006869 [Escallonia rubra]|uniref:Uncharacterized protein n=1 Tax=Escallonia rubra TaxID=112253 RepID=A0AA88UKN6_9ASTE|nr:hypothetical protein RJ640_006869 [Escallonia rubra]